MDAVPRPPRGRSSASVATWPGRRAASQTRAAPHPQTSSGAHPEPSSRPHGVYRQTSLLRMLLDQHVERVLVVETEGEILRDGDVAGVSQLLAATGHTSTEKFRRRVAADPRDVETQP